MKTAHLQTGSIRRGHTGTRLYLLLIAALLGVLLAAQARAQAQAQEIEAPPDVLPCQADHFELNRYRAELIVAGWIQIDESSREGVAARLADAFLPFRRFDGEGADLTSRRIAARVGWDAHARGRTLMIRPDAVLFLGGYEADDGRRAVECWVASLGNDFVDGLFDLAIAQGADFEDSPEQVVQYGPADLGEGREFTLYAVRHLATPTPALAASHGYMTRTTFPPSN